LQATIEEAAELEKTHLAVGVWEIGQKVGIKDCCLKRFLLTVALKGLVCKK